MYVLKTEIYSTKAKVTSKFEGFKEALEAAEHTIKVLGSVIPLTRHSSCTAPIQHCGYFADSYNEAFVSITSVKP
jgi:hypothetical protein